MAPNLDAPSLHAHKHTRGGGRGKEDADCRAVHPSALCIRHVLHNVKSAQSTHIDSPNSEMSIAFLLHLRLQSLAVGVGCRGQLQLEAVVQVLMTAA